MESTLCIHVVNVKWAMDNRLFCMLVCSVVSQLGLNDATSIDISKYFRCSAYLADIGGDDTWGLYHIYRL
jgi:hypothetical protein